MNETLFLLLNADNTSPHLLLAAAAFIADYVSLLVPLTLTVMWCVGRQREAAFRALLAALLALGLGQLISHVYFHPRPFMVPLGHTFATHAADASFPSDHGIVFFSVSAALLLCRRWLAGLLLLAAGVAVAWSRIYLGIHFPFDMLGALGVSLAACVIVWAGWAPAGARLLHWSERLYGRVLTAVFRSPAA